MSWVNRSLVVLALLACSSAALAKPKQVSAKEPAVKIVSQAEMMKTLKRHEGKIVVLHFWATWCVPCLDEIALMSELTIEGRKKGIELYAVSLDDATPEAAAYVGKVLQERGGTHLTKHLLKPDDPRGFVRSIDPRWDGDIPAFFVYDREGKLRRAFVGEMNREEFEKLVSDLNEAPTNAKE